MFCEKKMSDAIIHLYTLYAKANAIADCEDEEEMGCEMDTDDRRGNGRVFGLSVHEICQGLASRIDCPPQFKTSGKEYLSFNYHGPDLFTQKACLIADEVEQTTMGLYTAAQSTEMWMLEDGSFVNVECISIDVPTGDDNHYEIEYRRIMEVIEDWKDLRVPYDNVRDVLTDLCINQWESVATIYGI